MLPCLVLVASETFILAFGALDATRKCQYDHLTLVTTFKSFYIFGINFKMITYHCVRTTTTTKMFFHGREVRIEKNLPEVLNLRGLGRAIRIIFLNTDRPRPVKKPLFFLLSFTNDNLKKKHAIQECIYLCDA